MDSGPAPEARPGMTSVGQVAPPLGNKARVIIPGGAAEPGPLCRCCQESGSGARPLAQERSHASARLAGSKTLRAGVALHDHRARGGGGRACGRLLVLRRHTPTMPLSSRPTPVIPGRASGASPESVNADAASDWRRYRSARVTPFCSGAGHSLRTENAPRPPGSVGVGAGPASGSGLYRIHIFAASRPSRTFTRCMRFSSRSRRRAA
jgi:hypothetical protein